MRRLYFDINATTPMAPAVIERLVDLIGCDLKNPSSAHAEGRVARRLLEESRRTVAGHLDCASQEILFTSGASEANNTALKSIWELRPAGRNKIVTTTVEHDSVRKPLKRLEEVAGAEIISVPVDGSGLFDWNRFDGALDERTVAVSVMLANNETGMILPVEKIAKKGRQAGAVVHCDAACAVGKIPVSFRHLDVDFLCFSAHKFYGPAGSGALLVKKGVGFRPLLLGGGQEANRRAGTENLFGIVGMGEALSYARRDLDGENVRLWRLRKILKREILRIEPQALFHEHETEQLPGTVNVAFPSISGQTLMARLDLEGISVSYGSACSSGTSEVSRALLGLGIPEEEARSSIRISFGRMTTEEEVEGLVEILNRAVRDCHPRRERRLEAGIQSRIRNAASAGFPPGGLRSGRE